MNKNRRNTKSTRNATRSAASRSTRSTRSATSVNAAQPVAETVTFVSPRGKSFTVSNISQFASRYNLDRSALSKVARNERQSHKGWTSPQN